MRASLFSIVILVVFAFSAGAQVCLFYEDYMHICGGLQTADELGGIALDGTRLYLGTGGWLGIVDVFDPEHPVLLGEHFEYEARGFDIVVDGDRVYYGVGDGYPGDDCWIRIYDVSDPALPVLLGAAFTHEWPLGHAVAGDLLLAACDADGLRIFDVSNPAAPVQLSQLPLAGRTVSVAVYGDYAYVCNGDTYGMKVVDISDPAAPVQINQVATGLWPYDLVLNPPYLYMDANTDGVAVYSIADPAAPTLHTTVPIEAHQCFGISLAGDRLYSAGGGPGFVDVLDVSDPGHPVWLGYLDTPQEPYSIAGSATHAFVPDYNDGGMMVVDVDPPVTAEIMSTQSTPSPPYALHCRGDGLAYVMVEDALLVMDVSDPYHHDPPLSSIPIDPNRYKNDVTGYGDWAYMTTFVPMPEIGRVYFDVVDASDPENLVPRGGTYFGSYGTSDLAWHNGYVYASHMGSLKILDVTDPDHPIDVGHQGDQLSGPAGIFIGPGSLAYVADYWDGFVVFDVSTPANPTVVGSVYVSGGASDILVQDDIIYLATDEQGLQVYDGSNPAMPVLLGEAGELLNLGSLALHDGHIYASMSGNLAVFRVVDPHSPLLVGNAPAPGGIGSPCRAPWSLVALSELGLNHFYFQCWSTGVEDAAPAMSQLAVWPNPFNPQVTLAFTLAKPGNAKLELFDVAGRRVRSLIDSSLNAGSHVTEWRGLDAEGREAPSGVYFARLKAGETRTVEKLVLIR